MNFQQNGLKNDFPIQWIYVFILKSKTSFIKIDKFWIFYDLLKQHHFRFWKPKIVNALILTMNDN